MYCIQYCLMGFELVVVNIKNLGITLLMLKNKVNVNNHEISYTDIWVEHVFSNSIEQELQL